MLPDIMMVWLVLACSLPNFILFFTEPMPLIVRVANLLLFPPIWWWAAFTLRHPGRTIWDLFIAIFFSAFELVLLWLFGRDVIAVDMYLNLITTNPTEAGELLGNLWPSLVLVVVIYVPLLVFGVVYFKCQTPKNSPFRTKLSRQIIPGIIFVAGLISFFFCPAPYGRGYLAYSAIYPVNVAANLGIAIHRLYEVGHYKETSKDFTFHATSERPDSLPETYILVIGETSRADRWQLLNPGSDLRTNPRLLRRFQNPTDSTGALIAFPRAYSQSTTTHKAVPLMLSHLGARQYGDSITRVKSIITAFREAGFRTTFISNQLPNRSYIEFFESEADSLMYVPGLPTSDLLLPGMVKRILNDPNHQAKKNLIILHTYGAHFSYRDRYKDIDLEYKITPDNYSKASKKERPLLINSYDNNMIVVDSLLSSIISILTPRPGYTGMVYAGDHGEEIFDAEGLFLHATPFPTLNQLHVPFVVWVSPTLQKKMGVKTELDNRILPSSEAFSNTVMQMAGIRTPYLNLKTSALNKEAGDQDIYFLNDHNRAYPLSYYGIEIK